MKYILFFIAAFCSVQCFAQGEERIELWEKRKYKDHIEVKPINLMIGLANVNYERVITQKISAEIGYAHWLSENDGDEINGNSIYFNPRYYISKRKTAPEKSYIGPYFNYHILEGADANDTDGINAFEKGLLYGKQWLLDNGIVIDSNVGIAHVGLDLSDTEIGDDYDDIPLFLPKVGFAIGYRF